MKVTSKKADLGIGKKSSAVRAKLINRTTKCAVVARRGQVALAQEVVQHRRPPSSNLH